MRINRWLLGSLFVGAVFGAGGILGSIAFNRYTSTDAFCTSCHSMAFQANNSYFQHTAHRTNFEGVRPSCSDCHIPRNSWLIETYTHVSSGTRDLFAEITHNYGDPKLWEARRLVLAPKVDAEMRAQDSSTCRSCHDANVIQPKSEDGRKAHALLSKGGVTCVDCHTDIVHPPAASPTASSK